MRGVASELPTCSRARIARRLAEARGAATIEALAPLARHALHVLCGDDAAVLAHARKRLPLAEVARARRRLYAAIDRADLVVTKAGGLTVSECLARGRAMVLPFAAPGQERGNLFYALDAGAAVRPSELADLADTIEGLIGEPGGCGRWAHAHGSRRTRCRRAVVTCLFGEQEVARVA